MCHTSQITISNIPEISAIYFALLQCGYDYYTIARSQEHNERIHNFANTESVPPFFYGILQDTCQVYPYWPRAFILEAATFHLQSEHSQFQDYDTLRDSIMSAANIADRERDCELWDWITDFPSALSEVLTSHAFHRYLEWENSWIAEQNVQYQAELQQIKSCLDVCVFKYGSPVQDIRIIVNPIKCVHSADYHLDGSCFIFCSGTLRADSVIHEFLHHVIHPVVGEIADTLRTTSRRYPGIDDSYYLSGDDAGQRNAFEEFAVRMLTQYILKGNYPDNLISFLKELI